MKIEIKSCGECPFSNNDNEYGRDCCNLADKLNRPIGLEPYEQLPEDTIHCRCPLETEIVIRKL